MSLDYSNINNSYYFNDNTKPNIGLSSRILINEDENEFSKYLFGYDNIHMPKISYEEYDEMSQNNYELGKVPGMIEIINNNNYTDKSTNEKEKQKNIFLNKKRKKNIFYTRRIPKVKKLYKESKTVKKLEKRGRISYNENKEGKHNKFSGDNIINKIKVHVFNYLRDIIKKNSNEQIDLKKIGNKFSADLKVKQNIEQYKMKIKDILIEKKISTKYKTKDIFENKIIIEEIYKKQYEQKVIQILELTFEDLLILFRKKLNDFEDIEYIKTNIEEKIKGLDLIDNYNKYEDIEYFINEIREKYEHKISAKELEDYISSVEELCLNYINWFKNKKIRT